MGRVKSALKKITPRSNFMCDGIIKEDNYEEDG